MLNSKSVILNNVRYTKYTKGLGQLIRFLMIMFHMFADDSQLYTHLQPKNDESETNAKAKLEHCLNQTSALMTANRLKQNDSQPEFIQFGTKSQLSKISSHDINIGSDIIKASSHVRNLGAMLDNHLKMDIQVRHILKKCYTNLRRIRAIRPYLTLNATNALVQTLVMSHLDYCNSLLVGISVDLLNKLQVVQSARVVCRLRKCDHLSHVRKKLHWLRISERIHYKVAVITFSVLNGHGFNYLTKLLHPQKRVRSLRSKTRNLLDIPKTKLKTAGDRSVASTAPKIWNELRVKLRNCDNIFTLIIEYLSI